MNKKVIIGGTLGAILAGAGLFAIANEAGKEVAQRSAVEQPMIVDPNNPVTPDQLPLEPPAEGDEQTWGEWFADKIPGLGDTGNEDTPNDIINRNLGR